MHGVLAPGHRSAFEAARVAHNLLRAHAQAVRAYRAAGRHKIGLVVNIEPKHAASDSEADRRACARADAYMNRQYLDATLLGHYPPELAEVFGEAWPDWQAQDLAELHAPVDWLGLNYYTRSVVRHDAAHWPQRASGVRQPGGIYTETGWELYPQGLTESLLWMHQRYGGLPLYVTENGAAFYDPPSAIDGAVDDPLRVHYLRTHLQAVRDAIRQGADVRGYFAWSLLDNLEWAHGYAKRFRLVHVDFATQQRTPKASARFYRRVIASAGDRIDEAGGITP
jgi:beta-glucosidase